MNEEKPHSARQEIADALKIVIEEIIEKEGQAGALEAHMLVVDAILAAATDKDGFLAQERLSDGRRIGITPQTYGAAQLGIGEKPPLENLGVWADIWDFPTRAAALQAFETWDPETDPEPTGWHRHYKTGRYRTNGDPALEYVRWEGSIETQVRHAVQVTGKGQAATIESGHDIFHAFPQGVHVFHVTLESAVTVMAFHYLDRCVVATEEEMERLSVADIKRRLQAYTKGDRQRDATSEITHLGEDAGLYD